MIFKYSPNEKHYAFEPIPYLNNELSKKYNNKAQIFPYALAYSGINKRRYDISNPEIKEINVELRILHNIVKPNVKINFIKINIEGGEFGVLKGAKTIIKKDKPLIIFKCGKGASDYYDTTKLIFIIISAKI